MLGSWLELPKQEGLMRLLDMDSHFSPLDEFDHVPLARWGEPEEALSRHPPTTRKLDQ